MEIPTLKKPEVTAIAVAQPGAPVEPVFEEENEDTPIEVVQVVDAVDKKEETYSPSSPCDWIINPVGDKISARNIKNNQVFVGTLVDFNKIIRG